MQISDNEGGGVTVTLVKGHDLAKVPKSHRHLCTDAVRNAFADVPAYLQGLAWKCPFSAMSKWFSVMANEGTWTLNLCQGWSKKYAVAGLNLQHRMVRGALIAPAANPPLAQLPDDLATFYLLVDQVSWGGFSAGGGIGSVTGHPLASYAFNFHGDEVDLDKTYVWGTSGCGDMLIYTLDGRAGWLNHGSHEIVLRGKIADFIDEIFATMLVGETPELSR